MLARNEKIGIAAAVILLVAILSFVSFVLRQPAHASGQSIRCSDSVGAFSTSSQYYQNNCAAAATTTAIYFGNGTTGTATTTMLSVYDPTGLGYDVNLDATASTTSSVVWWQMAYSANGVNWYQETSSTGGVATPLFHSWTPASTTEQRINIRTNYAGSKFYRLQVWSSVASSSVYAQLVNTDAVPN